MSKAVLHYGNLSCSSQAPDRTSNNCSLALSLFLASPCHFTVLCLTLDKLLQLAFISAELNGTASYTMCLRCFFFSFLLLNTPPLSRLLFYLFLLLWPHIGDSWKAHDPQSDYTFSEELLLIQSFFVLMDLCS